MKHALCEVSHYSLLLSFVFFVLLFCIAFMYKKGNRVTTIKTLVIYGVYRRERVNLNGGGQRNQQDWWGLYSFLWLKGVFLLPGVDRLIPWCLKFLSGLKLNKMYGIGGFMCFLCVSLFHAGFFKECGQFFIGFHYMRC